MNTTKPPTDPKKQSKDSKIPKSGKPENLKLNLIHALFIHGTFSELYHDSIDHQFKNFVHDIIYVHELAIESSDNEELKNKMNYKPFNPEKNETEQKTTKQNKKKVNTKKQEKK